MRAILQRVSEAQVRVDGACVGSCGKGLLVLLGVGQEDTEQDAQRLWDKICRLRIFADEHGKTNLSLADVGGEVLVVSQFTLFADCRKGNRPSFAHAASAEQGNRLYEHFCACAQADVSHVGKGVFGAHMQVSLVNDGPFTVSLDTEHLSRRN
ncbi:MAG: D-aminoacyl-tRNA deacylase [Coriobacteriales bacterium]|nr:D-aminoacyl-tRNA deacylase [Coriobacteriales bacterium]